MALVRERRAVMETLIASDPQQALERSVPLDVWHDLPQELKAEIEEPFSALVRYRVLPVCANGMMTGSANFPDAVRYTEIEGGPSLETFVFGSRLGISSKVKAPVQGIRLGNRAALREGSFHPLTSEEAANLGFISGNYDIIGVYFVAIGMSSGGVTYGGLAGGTDIWIQGSTNAGLHVHEFGHNYGIGHSSFWKPPVGSSNPVDPAGTFEEYGDPFDIMGSGDLPEGVFHSQAKQLSQLARQRRVDGRHGGRQRHLSPPPHRPPCHRGRPRRPRDQEGGGYYWLSYRRLYENSWLKAGANLVWQRSGENRSWLVDTTPGSIPGNSDRTDGSISIGRTYSDGNSHITPLARSGNPNNEWLDIRVNTGPFAGNAAPAVTLRGPSVIAARQTCVFTAQSVDPNGDALAYSWDFGQGFAFDNHPNATFAWNSGGTYTVKVTVTDMKGFTAQATKSVTVIDPITTWTSRANNASSDYRALAASSNRVIAVAGRDISVSPDGTIWTTSQPSLNGYAYDATWDGSQFVIVGEDYSSDAPVGWRGAIFTSPAALANTWTRRNFVGAELNGIAYGNNVHVAVGDNGTIRRSTDGGLNWSLVSSGTTFSLASVAYGSGKFVVVGRASALSSGTPIILTSNDGVTWTDTTAGSGLLSWHDMSAITWAQDRFLASGFYSKLRQSTDLGATFSTTRTNDEEIAGFAYGNGIWFATGVDKDNANADVDLVSPDGSYWTNLTTPALDDRNAAIFFNNTFITAGDNHSIRQSGVASQAANGYFTWRESNFPDRGPLTTAGLGEPVITPDVSKPGLQFPC